MVDGALNTLLKANLNAKFWRGKTVENDSLVERYFLTLHYFSQVLFFQVLFSQVHLA
jgi:hypothetical protein